MQKFNEILKYKSQITKYVIPVLIIVLYLSLFLFPKIKELFSLLPETSQLKTSVITAQKDWDNFESFGQRIARLKHKLNFYEKSLPSEKEIAALLEFLSRSAKELDVRISEIQPGQREEGVSKGSIYYQVPISLTAECGYHQLGYFINKLENADRFMKISEIRVTANPARVNSHYVRLAVVTYVLNK